MNPSTVADTLTGAGALLGVNRQRQLVTDRVPAELASLVTRHQAELALTVTGAAAGHGWHRCDTCHRTTLRKGQPRKCYLTPRCDGTIAKPAPADPDNGPCRRPGCTRPLELTTLGLCHPCLTHLAHLQGAP